MCVATRSYRRTANGHRKPLARYGAIEGARRERLATAELHHHTGHDLKAAHNEYQAVVAEVLEYASTGDEDEASEASDLMSFEEFCKFCNRLKITDRDATYIGGMTDKHDHIARGRFNTMAGEISRIPHISNNDLYWSERSILGSIVCILTAHSMLQSSGSARQISMSRSCGNSTRLSKQDGSKKRRFVEMHAADNRSWVRDRRDIGCSHPASCN